MTSRERILSLLKARSASLELKLKQLLSYVQEDRLMLHKSSSSDRQMVAGSHVLGEHVSCMAARENVNRSICFTNALNPQREVASCTRMFQQLRRGKEICPKLTVFQRGQKRVAEEGLLPITQIDTALDAIHDVYHVDSCELIKRNTSAIRIQQTMRGFLLRRRRAGYGTAIQNIRKHVADETLAVVTTGILRCREIGSGISRMLRRRRRKVLFKYWHAICNISHGGVSILNIQRQPRVGSISSLNSIEKKHSATKTWENVGLDMPDMPAVLHTPTNCPTTHTNSRDIIKPYNLNRSFILVADAALSTAQTAFSSIQGLASVITHLSIRTRAIVTRAQAFEDFLQRTVVRTWRHWTRVRVEGRLALVLAEPFESCLPHSSAGSEFYTYCLLRKKTCSGLKARFTAPHDMQAAARIAHCSRLRRYCGAWRLRSSVLKEVGLRQRRKLTQLSRTHLRAWHAHAIRLQSARSVALDRWRSHLLARLSGPLHAWYLWAHARIIQRKDTERVVSGFARLKRRHVAAVTLRAWRHAAELNRLEARYTRRQLMGALAEQKGHVRRLERLADDHDLARAELDNAADLAHERSAKLARSALVRDDDCRFLESRLENAENDVASAQRVLLSIESERSALARHILRIQPVVGFTNQGLSKLARDRDARLGAGVTSSLPSVSGDFMPSRTPPDVDGTQLEDLPNRDTLIHSSGFLLATTIADTNAHEDVSSTNKSISHIQATPRDGDSHEDIIELPVGMTLIRHPNETGGLMLCRQSASVDIAKQPANYVDGGTDVTKHAFAIRLDWVLAAVNHNPPLVEFCPLTHVAGAPLFKDTVIKGAEYSKKQGCDPLDIDTDGEERATELYPAEVSEVNRSFTPMLAVSLGVVEKAALGLLKALREMYGIFEFLRDGDTTALPQHLLASWNAVCTNKFIHPNSRQWKHLTLKAPPSGYVLRWSDVWEHIGAGLLRGRPNETKSDQMVRHIVGAQDRVKLTYITLYSGATRHLRPNTYASHASAGDIETGNIKLWDSTA